MATENAAVRKPHAARLLGELTRARVTAAVTLTTATGYFIGAGRADAGLVLAVVGVFLLAAGASALNQCQEQRIDARMERTRHRPLPAGLIDLPTALFVAVLLVLLGSAVLASITAHARPLLLLGGLALAWYNGVYTYLKRVTAFAVVPGALIGALPPIIGFVAGGGNAADPRILLVATFFFVWQIPHFWLLLLVCGREYERAGLPALTAMFSGPQLRRITFMWIAGTAAAGLVIPAVDPTAAGLPGSLAIGAASVWLVNRAAALPPARDAALGAATYRRAFMEVNAYALIVMICLSVGALQAGA